MSVKLLTEHHLELLSLKDGCRGSSESTLVQMPHCRKSHVAAQMNIMSGPRDQWVKIFHYSFLMYDIEITTPVISNCQSRLHMGLDTRKPVFRGLRTTQAQTSLRIRAV